MYNLRYTVLTNYEVTSCSPYTLCVVRTMLILTARVITLHISRHCEMTYRHHRRKRRNQQKASPRSNRQNYSLDRLTAMITMIRIKVLEMMTMTIITMKTTLDLVLCSRPGFIVLYWTRYVLRESLHFSRGPISD